MGSLVKESTMNSEDKCCYEYVAIPGKGRGAIATRIANKK